MGVIMAETPVPDEDHANRGCSKGFVNGQVVASAFSLRPQEKTLLKISADWVECPHVPPGERNPKASVNRMKGRRVKGPYAIIPVTDIRQVKHNGSELDVTSDSRSTSSHCSIVGFSGSDALDHELQLELAILVNKSQIIDR